MNDIRLVIFLRNLDWLNVDAQYNKNSNWIIEKIHTVRFVLFDTTV